MQSPQETRDILGANLRLLTELKGSQTDVSNALGIGRVQFGRYLSGQSFPKPDILKRLCDYFHVDARIVLEPLDPKLLGNLGGHAPNLPVQLRNPQMEEMIGYVTRRRDFRVPYEQIPNGIHRYWKSSFLKPGFVATGLMRFYDLNYCRVVRGYEVGVKVASNSHFRFNPREFRTALIDTGTGFCLMNFSSCTPLITFSAYNYDTGLHDNYKLGFSAIANNNAINLNRFSHSVLEILPQDTATILSCARQSGYMPTADLPPFIRDYMETPLK